MDVHVQDTDFDDIGLFENYESFIWTERYSAYGDFELNLPITKEHKELLSKAVYLTIPSSKKTMVVETALEKETIKVTGRSLESILERRVVETAGSVPFTSLTDYIKRLLMYNIAGWAYETERNIPFFGLYASAPDGFTDPTAFDGVKYGENLYTAVKTLCDSVELGFELVNPKASGVMNFSLYYGKDKTGRDKVIFSESVGNVQNVSELRSNVPYKNVAVVNLPPWDGSVGLGELWRVNKTGTSMPSGVDRREFWTDASDLRQDDTFTVDNKPERAMRWGRLELFGHPLVNEIDFELSKTNPFSYGSDYNLGDIVLVTNNSGDSLKYRVTEYIQSFGPEGDAAYPTLTAV